MAIDILPETESRPGTLSDPQPQSTQRGGKQQSSTQGRWWKRGLLAISVLAAVALAAVLISGSMSSPETGPKLTHTITRGDLLVTVTEQGTLESSDNTEIKCKVRGRNTVIWVVENGTRVEPGDELVRLDILFIEEQIAERTKYALWSRSGAERSKADAARSRLAVSEYEEGRFPAQLMMLKKDLAISESNLRTARNMLNHAKKMFERGYRSKLEVEEKTFAVTQAELNVSVKLTEIEVLEDFTKKEELTTLRGNLNAIAATHAANVERAYADGLRRDRAVEELGYCVIKAEKSGMVLYPSAAAWKNAPDIEEGATVHRDQILLLMPDLSKMQVKIGIHESIIDRIKPGMTARVALPDKTLVGEVSTVASITRPAGWWTGNVVKYDTIIELPSVEGLKPGMSAEVEVILAVHEDVLTIPVAAVVETGDEYFCWVKTAEGAQRHALKLGDSNDVFIVVKAGLQEGDEVVLNPLAFIEEAQTEALKPLGEANPRKGDSTESGSESKPQKPGSDKQTSDSKKPADTKPKATP
jgi:HlyD family secretion protein